MSSRREDARLVSGLILSALLTTSARPADAQEGIDRPIGPFVIDVRGSLAPVGQNTEFAAPRGFNPGIAPGIGLGFEAGAHIYVYRWRVLTFGLGGSVHTSSASRGPSPDDFDPDGPTLRQRFVALSPQLSLNFGSANGWSYLSGGVGTSRLSLYDASRGAPSQRRTNTLNYGGGARWFTGDHLAFSLDLRFYALTPLIATHAEPSSPRMTVMVLSVGTSFK